MYASCTVHAAVLQSLFSDILIFLVYSDVYVSYEALHIWNIQTESEPSPLSRPV